MKIVIDGRMINESGIGRYIRNLLAQLQQIDNKDEYFILHLEKDFRRLNYGENFHGICADFKWYGVVEQTRLPGLLESIKPDLVHFPHFNVPLLYGGKFVVTVHDLIHQHFSMQRASTHGAIVYKLKQLGYRKVFQNAVRNSTKILTPSNFIKGQLINDWNIDGDKVVVTPEAVDGKILHLSQESRILPAGGQVKSQEFLKRFNITRQYIFYVGNAHPHKNVEGLIRAFGELRKKHPDLFLVLSGSDHYFWQRIKKESQGMGIIFTGQISDEELVALYKNAEMFVMPSLEEGFGIPLLEAMACKCPVVSSSKGSLPEVGGDAALYFDPGDAGDMGEKMDKVLKSEKVSKELIEKGLKRIKLFSWQELAQKTLEVYHQCG